MTESHTDKDPAILGAEEASAGRKTGYMPIILGVSLILALIALGAVFGVFSAG